jgi:hypothetical protein
VARTASDTLPTSQGNGAGASPLEFRPRTVIVASILAAAVIATAGSLSVISLGDETSHIRQTRAYAESGSRVPYDPLFSSIDNKDPRPFGAAPLWHAGLAILWRLIGSPSQMVAQIYQAGFYLLLLLSVYFGVRQIWNDSAASWAWLLIATMPMACAYSMLLYQDVPGIAVSALGLFLLFRRNFLWAGICLAGAYLVKMNMLSYAPWAVVFAAWWARGTWKRRLTAAVLVAVPLASALGYDIIWRMAIYGSIMGMCVGDLSGLSANAMEALGARPANFAAWNPDTIYTPRSLLSHLGIPVVLGVGAAVVRAWDCVSKWMWVGVGLCCGVCASWRAAGPVCLSGFPGLGYVGWQRSFPFATFTVALCHDYCRMCGAGGRCLRLRIPPTPDLRMGEGGVCVGQGKYAGECPDHVPGTGARERNWAPVFLERGQSFLLYDGDGRQAEAGTPDVLPRVPHRSSPAACL